jgi:hypothetical protein
MTRNAIVAVIAKHETSLRACLPVGWARSNLQFTAEVCKDVLVFAGGALIYRNLCALVGTQPIGKRTHHLDGLDCPGYHIKSIMLSC